MKEWMNDLQKFPFLNATNPQITSTLFELYILTFPLVRIFQDV